MKSLLFVLLSFMIANNDARQQSTAESLEYIAAVVEYHPFRGNSFDAVQRNLENYLEIINNASAESVDIIVFPEATLNRDWEFGVSTKFSAVRVPPEAENAIPCGKKDEYSEILDQLSCAASSEKMYIVVNVAEIANCTDTSNKKCKEGEDIFFNTNVVFDRSGKIISRYRKINLFGEAGFTESLDKALGIFDTDFGVRFGHFICFDLMFQQPAVQIVEKENITNVVFPTMWFSELPSLTAVEIQESWAATHNVNFLAAGANNPHIGSTGSGIYSGKFGALNSTMNGLERTEVLISKVPKIPKINNSVKSNIKPTDVPKIISMDKLHLTSYNMKMYQSELINVTLEHQTINLTHGNMSCEFKITINKNFISKNKDASNHYIYRVVIFEGVRSFDYKNGGVNECLLVACTSNELSSCGHRFENYSEIKSIIEISSIELTATVLKPVYNSTTQAMNSAYYPVTLTTAIMPLNRQEVMFATSSDNESDKHIIKMTMNSPQSELLTFGVFGRVFSNDHLPATDKVIGSNHLISYLTLMLVLLPILSYLSRW
ncbi:vanin-like protein 1 [Arctopsyche grandis]|uniref:vanin-like protein 1 n=1 Tax=Arctopsyche grandis TaxID=121162 RepID=UPI00406D9AE0